MPMTKRENGWRAEDIFDFDGPRRLQIETYKYNGSLITRAAVNKYEFHSVCHAFGLAGGGDYSERVIVTSARGTEKAVAEQHAKALQQLAEITSRARAHYAKAVQS